MRKLLLFLFVILISSELMSQSNWQVTLVNTGAETIYDLASSSSTQWIMQDPNDPNSVHAIVMVSPWGDPAPSFPGRRTYYYYSSDKGQTWSFSGIVNNRKAGFCSIDIASDGTAIVCHHTSTVAIPMTRVMLFKDAAPGLGAFSEIDPPNSEGILFGKFVLTSSLTLPINWVVMGMPMTSDSALRRTGSGTNWSAWTEVTNTGPEAYSLARGTDGRIGIAYINHNTGTSDNGCVFFIESTNNGVTFSPQLKIFEPSLSDSLAAFRGISLAYKGNTPCVTYEIVKQDPGTTSYYQKAPAKIMFWNPQLQGSDPNKSISIADKGNVWIPSPDSIMAGENDQFGSLCRPVVGVSSDTNIVYVAFQAFTNKWGGISDTTNFKAIYLTRAAGNFNFSAPEKITPDSPLRDWSYPSISNWNEKTGGFDYAYITALSDSTPGTYPNSNSNGPSRARLYFILAKSLSSIGIKKINGIASDYSLSQNYPNPFNPETRIAFTIRKAANTKLTVYDITGKAAEVLVNEVLQAGSYEAVWNAGKFSSGVYFYKLETDGFTDVKRMVLVK